jgi:hypothetical protein
MWAWNTLSTPRTPCRLPHHSAAGRIKLRGWESSEGRIIMFVTMYLVTKWNVKQGSRRAPVYEVVMLPDVKLSSATFEAVTVAKIQAVVSVGCDVMS